MNDDPTPPQTATVPPRHSEILVVVLVYAGFAALWILLSDKAVEWLFSEPAQIILASTVKGGLFVAVTSLLLYGLMRRMTGASPTMTPARFKVGAWRPALPFILLASAILALTAAGIGLTFTQQRDKEVARLQAIADLKARQIADWLIERQGDAELIRVNPFFAASYRHWRDANDSASRGRLQAQLELFREHPGFSAMLLLDAQGERLWGSAQAPREIAPPLRDAARQAANDMKVHRVGPYRGMAGTPRLDFVIPLTAAGPHPPLAVLHVAPSDWLFRTLQNWPVPSASGETLLVRRDGDQVQFLNELRHRKNSALNLRLPLASPKLLAAQVLRGEVQPGGLVEGEDYRQVAALGVAHPIPGSDWFLLAKLDSAELYGEAIRDTVWIGLVGLLALFMAAQGYNLLRQRQQLALAVSVQQSQAERLRALRLLAAIADSSDDAIFAKDMEGRYLLFNQAASRFVGKPVEAVLGQDDRAIFPPDQAEMLMTTGRWVIAENRVFTQQEVLDTAEGERVFLATKGPLHDEQGNTIGIFGISRDITEMKRAEVAQREHETKYRSLFENSMDGVLLTTPDGGILSANPEAQRILGYSEEELRHIGRAGIVDASDPRLAAALAERARTGRFRGELTLRAKDGTSFPAEVSSLIFHDSQGRATTSMFVRNIVAQKAAEEALRQQTEELAQRNAELEHFNRSMVGRELDMIALKKQVNELAGQAGKEPPYPLAFLDTPAAPLAGGNTP